ncbi:L-lysine 6-oxidase [Rubripirellula lacrimiformis]|uniref:L-lysine 6-oxidase n=1 Tax=Rubripirellula lacrimiformis TaxID=1930273 RepID=A0A517N7M1_9BACT|nr:LodA/GoxA family CTQ-dependent oxidase [Rubripirellula lacrimiformis]QDT03110.1 L-lysine 6-oxidase [Rubripirellula lacrimiformis]
MAKSYRIHPAIGVARVGNSMETFIGPEIPGTEPAPIGGAFKADGRLKRQAARFRVFEYDSDNPTAEPLEVTTSHSEVENISWTVKLANRKAAGNVILSGGNTPRNPGISESELVIAPSAKTLSAPGQSVAFDDGKFRGKVVPLGHASTESSGNLVVAGGFGTSNFVVKPGEQGGYSAGGGLNFANNRFWYDDTSDGSINATIQLSDGTTVQAEQAWIIVGPPDYAPGVGNIVTLYELMLDLVVRQFSFAPNLFSGGAFDSTYRPSFTNEIYPILHRVSQQGWVSRVANMGHANVMLRAFNDLSFVPTPGNDPHQSLRELIFHKLRDPDNPNTTGNMPRLNGDGEVNPVGLTLRPLQYFLMKQWKDGLFVGDWSGIPALSSNVTAWGLDQAALEHCTGGSFFPGIEVNRIVATRPDIYQADSSNVAVEIRLRPESANDDRPAGYLTQDNAMPWQADFLKCRNGWWPAQRPDEVLVASGGPQLEWDRDKIANHKDMVERWHELGVVAQSNGEYIETERNPDGMFLV